MEREIKRWQHPGGKLFRLGAASLSDTELLAILISSGIPGHPAEEIAGEVIERFGSLRGIAETPLDDLACVKGLGKVKSIRIAAALELARRIVEDYEGGKDEDRQRFRIQEPVSDYPIPDGP